MPFTHSHGLLGAQTFQPLSSLLEKVKSSGLDTSKLGASDAILEERIRTVDPISRFAVSRFDQVYGRQVSHWTWRETK